MKILLWIDLQYDYIKFCKYEISSLNETKWIEFLKTFDKRFFVLDETNWTIENEFSNQEWLLIFDFDEDQYYEELYEDKELYEDNYTNYVDEVFYKQYWFFRDIMDNWKYEVDEIIEILKFFYELELIYFDNSITNFNWQNIKKFEKTKLFQKINEFLKEKKIELVEFWFYFPQELIKTIKNNIELQDEITLIWWWEKECLEEIFILLKVIWYNNIKFENEYIYD